MKTRITLFAAALLISALMSSCFYSGGYRYRPDYYSPRYAPQPYVRVIPPQVYIRPRVYVAPRRHNTRPQYNSRNYNNQRNSRSYNNHGRRRW